MKNLLIDKSAILYRFCFGRNVLNEKHEQIGGVLNFLIYLVKIDKKYKFDNIIIVSDSIKNKRKSLNTDYKKNRQPMPEFIKEQFKLTNKLIKILGIQNIKIEGYEADDIIYTICKKQSSKENKFYILTSDKDICHSLNSNCYLWMVGKKDILKINTKEEFEIYYGIHPDKYSFYLSLAGDKSDNISGVKNIGKVTAKKIIDRFENIDELYLKIEEIKEIKVKEYLKIGKEKAYESFSLAKPFLILEDIELNSNKYDENKWKDIQNLESFSKEILNFDIKKII